MTPNLVPLGHVLRLQRGISWAASQEREQPGTNTYPVLRIPNIQDRLDLTDVIHVKLPKARAEQFRVGQQTILMVGSNGNPHRVGNAVFIDRDPGFLYASFLMAARVSDPTTMEPRYVFHFISSPRVQDALTRSVQGSTGLKNLSERVFDSIRIPALPLAEQRRIAEILDSLDAVIQKTEKIVAKLNAVGRGLLHDLMTRGLGPSDKLRDPREEPNQFPPSLVGLNPKQWRVQPIKEFCLTYAGGTPPRDVPRMFGGSIPWVKSSEVNKPTINATEECLTELGMEASSAKLVPPKTPLLAMYGATAGTISWLEIEATTNQAVLALVPNRKIASSRWLYWALQFYSGRLVASVQGSGQPNLSKKLVDSLLIAVPSSLTEQGLISNILDAHMERVQSELRYLNKLRLLKQGLMDDLLSGKVRVPVHEEVVS